MPYVERDGDGKVKGVYALLQPGYAEEFLAADDPAVVAFLDPPPSTNPADYKLSKRQISAALILSGTSTDPNGFITGVIGAITDATAKALALNDWQNAPYYMRDNQLFNEPNLLAAANLTSAQVDALWLLAKDQPA